MPVQDVTASDGFEIVNFNGTLYHGSPKPVEKFDVHKGNGRYGKGLYLTPDIKTAQFYAQGGRQGAAGQKLKESGYLYEFKVVGKAFKILDEEDAMRFFVSEDDDASEAFQQNGDATSARVTKFLSEWARDMQGCPLVWMADVGGVLTPFEQMVVTDQKCIRSMKSLSWKKKVESLYAVHSFAVEDLVSAIVDWVSAPTPVSFGEMKHVLSELPQIKKALAEPTFSLAFRGMSVTERMIADLDAGKTLQVNEGSWSFDEDEARRFAEGYDLAIIFKRKISKKDTILDLVKAADLLDLPDSTADTIRSEAEVVLTAKKMSAKDIVWRTGDDEVSL